MSDASARPTAHWIRWPGYLAWVFLATLVLAVLTVRSGNWQQGLLLYAIWLPAEPGTPRFLACRACCRASRSTRPRS
jgi:hypothetical protein